MTVNSNRTIDISLSKLINDASNGVFHTEYRDQYIVRSIFSRQITENTALKGTIDFLQEYNIFNFNLSFNNTLDYTIQLFCDFPCIFVSRKEKSSLSSENSSLAWLPTNFKAISLGQDNRIRSIQECPRTIQTKNSHLTISIPPCPGDVIDVSFCVFKKDSHRFFDQIEDLSPAEQLNVTRGRWFYYSGIHDFWKYIVNCRFYNRRDEFPFESQVLAYVFYFYFTYLHKQTNKELYCYLKEYTAYMILLSLPKNNGWQHGIWMKDDIHYVHWIAGANIFLSHYEMTGQTVFLEKSQSLIDEYLSLSDHCVDDTRWFLHDSFEVPQRYDITYYTDVIVSNAFQKSKENTLAINSHLSALLVLHKFYELTQNKKYIVAYQQGFKLLSQVLQANPATFFYSISYRIRDILLKILVHKEKILLPNLVRFYDNLLRKTILPKLKEKYPRLVMPNGFIERDLTFSFLNQFYHLLNIEQLLMIYQLEPDDWLKELISESVNYSIRSKMVLYFASSDELSLTFLGILLQYGTHINPEYLKVLEEYAVFFHKKGFPLPVKLIASPFISDVHSTINTSNPHILPLISDINSDILGIVLNISPEEQKFKLICADDRSYNLEDWHGNRISAFNTTCINGFSSLKVVLKK